MQDESVLAPRPGRTSGLLNDDRLWVTRRRLAADRNRESPHENPARPTRQRAMPFPGRPTSKLRTLGNSRGDTRKSGHLQRDAVSPRGCRQEQPFRANGTLVPRGFHTVWRCVVARSAGDYGPKDNARRNGARREPSSAQSLVQPASAAHRQPHDPAIRSTRFFVLPVAGLPTAPECRS